MNLVPDKSQRSVIQMTVANIQLTMICSLPPPPEGDQIYGIVYYLCLGQISSTGLFGSRRLALSYKLYKLYLTTI